MNFQSFLKNVFTRLVWISNLLTQTHASSSKNTGCNDLACVLQIHACLDYDYDYVPFQEFKEAFLKQEPVDVGA